MAGYGGEERLPPGLGGPVEPCGQSDRLVPSGQRATDTSITRGSLASSPAVWISPARRGVCMCGPACVRLFLCVRRSRALKQLCAISNH